MANKHPDKSEGPVELNRAPKFYFARGLAVTFPGPWEAICPRECAPLTFLSHVVS